MKKWYILMIFCFIFPIFVFGIISMIDRDPVFSVNENRMLKQLPEFSLNALLDGSYMVRLEEYYSDTFPLREAMMPSNKMINAFYTFQGKGGEALIESGDRDLGEGESLIPNNPNIKPQKEPPKKPDKPVTEGKLVDKGLILMVGDRAIEVYTHMEEKTQKYVGLINRLYKDAPDVKVYSLMAPTSQEFYSSDSFRKGNKSQQKTADLIASKLSNGITQVPVIDTLKNHSGEYLYFRSDHHWTARGAYYSYVEFAKAAGFDPVAIDTMKTGKFNGFLGSLYRYVSNYPQADELKNNPDFVEYFLPTVETKATVYYNTKMKNGIPIAVVSEHISDKTSNKYLCFISGDNPITKIVTSVKNGKRLLVTKESYANAFVPFLTHNYEEIYVVDPRMFNSSGLPKLDLPSFIKTNKIGEVLVLNYSFAVSNSTFIDSFSAAIP